MAEETLSRLLREALAAHELSEETLSALASSLLWRFGRAASEGEAGPVVVRVGFAKSARRFAELPRLKSVSDAEVEAAAQEGSLRVEWVGER
ncbi:DUF3248 domain-containing protein [Truepera radiovictrix]|uniref:Uncharacterized protein n=1 Tax=Truepera radiovictrix (strain DSM 17093 / CIP 108686 / LMG 22925 / RQ-24) TaxID=649638 RepID=D7CW48_TRURR|nr:DUF3248 domain-containing protein [Truepera radiovictrix]ADI14311.1 hypothetical protein Trad_1187 [Truepera radiovictrix DSM 17093]WMT57133.1 DUF3248 domain-containing protein [Truepera radiovictrix]